MKKIAFSLLVFCLFSCTYFKQEEEPSVVARVGESYLKKSDLDSLVPSETTKADSLVIVKNYIERWVTEKLLINAAERNLDDAKKEAFAKLIRQYKNDLYTKAYIEKVVQTTVDTLILESELKEYYQKNKQNFKTNNTLVQLRYLHLSKDHPKYELIKQKFGNIKRADSSFWRTHQVQFINSALNDSVWVSMSEVYKKVPIITPENRNQYINEGMSFEKSNAFNEVYLVKVKKVLNRNEVSPYEYIKPTLAQVILNKRKLELIKRFEKEIKEDAIKNKDYEIYQ